MSKKMYWSGIVWTGINPLYILVLIVAMNIEMGLGMAVAMLGGIFFIPGTIGTIAWGVNFYKKYCKQEVEIKEYKLPLILRGVNILFIVIPVLSRVIFFI